MRKLIVIEGVDGSGKATQTKLLVEALNKHYMPTKTMSFPNYGNSFFAKEVEKYLNGEYGSVEDVPVKFAASLYAGDRFESKEFFENYLIKQSYNIVLDRYTPSNIAHQCGKLKSRVEQLELEQWIEQLEYKVYGLPKPNYVIFLNVPPETSQALVLEKEKRSYTELSQDLHEGDLNHLTNSHQYFLSLAEKNNWIVIECIEDGVMRSVESIHEEIFNIVKGLTRK